MKEKSRTVDGALYLNAAAAAKFSGVSEQYLRDLVYKGKLTRLKSSENSRLNWYPKDELLRLFGEPISVTPVEPEATTTYDDIAAAI